MLGIIKFRRTKFKYHICLLSFVYVNFVNEKLSTRSLSSIAIKNVEQMVEI